MLNENNIPKGFRVVSSSYDDLFIKYFPQQNVCMWVVLLFFFPPLAFLFIGHVGILFLGLYHILHLNFREALQDFSYGKDNLWYIFLFIFAFLFLGITIYYLLYGVLYSILGVTEIKASKQSLIIDAKIQKFTIYNKSILTENIYYFLREEYKNDMGEVSWAIKIITNQIFSKREMNKKIKFLFLTFPIPEYVYYKSLLLWSDSSIELINWLGKLLADFYKVEFLSANKNTYL